MQFHIEDMTCGGCARSVTAAIRTIDPNAAVETDLGKRNVSVSTNADSKAIVEALTEAGFTPAAI